MILRVVSDTCTNENCHIIRCNRRIKSNLSLKKFNKEDAILSFFKKISFDTYFCSYDTNFHEITAYLNLTESRYKYTFHLHSISIKNIQKLQSCFYDECKFFHLSNPDHLHVTNLNHI